jgi:DNA-3-methyladenine glycosylase II
VLSEVPDALESRLLVACPMFPETAFMDGASGAVHDGDEFALIWLELCPKPPFRLDYTVWALRRRSHNRVDRWDGGYDRALTVNGRCIDVRVTQHSDSSGLILRVLVPDELPPSSADRDAVRSQLTRMLGLDVDLGAFYRLAEEHPRTAVLKERFVGLRPPRFPTLFEALVNAVANQQLSLEVGIELLNRFSDAFGRETAGGHRAFPGPEPVVSASPQELRALGFSWAKADYVIGIAESVLSGELDPVRLSVATRADVQARLMDLRGVGRWSAEYVMLRGLGRLDVFPGDDVGARNKLQRFLTLEHAPTYDEIAARLKRWQPYSGMLYFHLLLDGLVERGALEP